MTFNFMHPGLAEPRTKEEWRGYLDAVPPARPVLPPFHTYQALPDPERLAIDDDRHAWHSALIIVRTPTMKHIHTEIQVKLLTNARQPAGARRSVVLDGPPTVGKSTLVKLFSAEFERTLRLREPESFGRTSTTGTSSTTPRSSISASRPRPRPKTCRPP
jgi:hypothetical protein